MDNNISMATRQLYLKQRQSQPLEIKIQMTLQRIREWYEYWNGAVYVSFSGGKDSTVLLHLVRSIYPDVPAVFVDTGLEYPEIREFVKTIENVVVMRPKKPFTQVIREEGYPVVSKKVARYVSDLQNAHEGNAATRNLRLTGMNQAGKYCPSMVLSKKWRYLVDAPFKVSDKCCDIMKKEPMHRYAKESERHPITGVMAIESQRREKKYLETGCNAFDSKEPISQPIGFWTERDILLYLKRFNVPYATVYGDIIETPCGLTTTGEKRTGCCFCMFGVTQEKGENRFQRMKRTHPRLYTYCIEQLGLGPVLDYLKVGY